MKLIKYSMMDFLNDAPEDFFENTIKKMSLLLFSKDIFIYGSFAMSIYLKTFDNFSDIDFSVTSAKNRKNINKYLLRQEYDVLRESKYSKTYVKDGLELQCSKKSKKSIEKMFESFDLSICRICINEGYIYLTEESEKDLQNRELRVKTCFRPFSTFMRLNKYGKKGFTFSVEEAKKLEEMLELKK